MTMTTKKYQYMESPYLCRALQPAGLTSNTQRDIVAKLKSLLGLNNGYLYGNQGRNYIPALMDFGKSEWITGHHHRDSIEGHKLDIDFSGPLFANNSPSLTKLTTESWVTSTWKCIIKKGNQRKYPKPGTLTLKKLTYHGRLSQGRNPRRINSWTK